MTKTPDVLCIGAMLWDVIGRAPRRMAPGADVPGRIRHLPGGVALNVAVALARWGMTPSVLSAVGRDSEGEGLIAEAQRLGVMTEHLTRDAGLPTDCYMAIEDSEGLIAAVADALGGHYFNRMPVLPDMIVNAAAGREQSYKPLQVSSA